ncbi:MAG: hypothetical protein ACP5QZ_01855 [Candidatus Sumerlaeaceae bacterium]
MTPSLIHALIAQCCIGSAVLSLVPPTMLSANSRATKAAIILLCGLLVPGLFLLFLLCLSFPFDSQWLYAIGALGAVITIFRRNEILGHWRTRSSSTSTPSRFPIALAIGLLALAVWTTLAAICLPSVDYDSIVIWSYRVRVLLTENTLYTPSLRDPLRIAPMPKHPYLLPVIEAAFCGRSGFSQLATHIPHLGFYFSFVFLAIGVAREWFAGELRFVFLAAMLLMPAPSVQWWLEGAREPAIGVAAFWSTYWFIRWMHEPTRHATAFIGLAVAAMYHMKIEGAVFAAGTLAAMLTVALLSADERRLRLWQVAGVAFLFGFFAVPWLISKALIPPTTQDYDFTEGFAKGWGRRLHFVPTVMWMGFSEIFLRPELYGVAPHLAVVWLARGIRQRTWRIVLPAIFPTALCLAGILAIYVVRQEQLGAARNVTFSRRFVCVMPTFVLVAAYAFSQASQRQKPADG